MLSVGAREILPAEEVEVGRWRGGAREVRWARWKSMWKSSRERGMRAGEMAVHTMPPIFSASPSSILAKR